MDTYIFALALGGAGLVAMAAAGVSHLGGDAGHGDAAGHASSTPHGGGDLGTHATPVTPGPHPHSGEHADAHGHGHHHEHGRDVGGDTRTSLGSALLAIASPRVLFSLLVGFGAIGLVTRPLLAGVLPAIAVSLLVPCIAVVGAVLFDRYFVTRLWNAMFRFASNPAETLDHSVLSTARATSAFDANGEGIVAVEVDGQIVQCLGRLRSEDRALGVRVRAGDVLRVEEVDGARQRCTVSYVGHDVPSA